ncbi:MAG: BTAD domain-containing putative transcriptional regulator [Acidobacteriota bacterium]
MRDSFFRRIQKILETPKPSPHHLQYRSVIPLRTRIWESIRPPKKIPSTTPPITRGQRRLLQSVAAIVVPGLIGWGIYVYVDSAPDRSYSRLQEGITLSAAGKLDQAIGKFSEAISMWQYNSRAYLERGNAYVLSARPEQAKEDWSRAIELDPKLAAAYAARGSEYRVEGRNEKALADLEHSISLHPSGDAYYQIAQVFASLGENKRAIENYSLAIALLPAAPFVYFSRAAAKNAEGDLEGGEEDRATALRLAHAAPDAKPH